MAFFRRAGAREKEGARRAVVQALRDLAPTQEERVEERRKRAAVVMMPRRGAQGDEEEEDGLTVVPDSDANEEGDEEEVRRLEAQFVDLEGGQRVREVSPVVRALFFHPPFFAR